ncbi:hypothetical protein E6C67_14940 [Azospirillum sp. TSA2s]|nr:hypothetical protein E6C67_14940 [Azospirillum sp. TSA2s]
MFPLPPGERVRVRGMHFEDLFGSAEPPHPNLLPAFGGPWVRLSCQRKLCLRVSRGEKEQRSGDGHAPVTCPDTPAAPRRCPADPGRCLPSRRGRSG